MVPNRLSVAEVVEGVWTVYVDASYGAFGVHQDGRARKSWPPPGQVRTYAIRPYGHCVNKGRSACRI
jgi:hypothetical protein